MASSKAEKSSKAKKGKAPRSLKRVLLVEDDPVLALALEDALLDGGAGTVVICATMQATIAELEKDDRPDALILDVHLADRDDGWALAELVTLLGPKPPRIAFSTGSPEDIPPNIAEMGCIFEKPYDPKQLVDVLASERKGGLFARLRGAIG